MTLSEALKSYRSKHHLLQKQIASVLRISLKHYNRLENDHAHVSSKVMKRICDLTSMAISYSFVAREQTVRYGARHRKRRRPAKTT